MKALRLLLTMLVLLVGGYLVAPAQAQSNFWVLVNGVPTVTGRLTTSVNGLATTSTDGLVLQNATAATSGATVQMSPRARLRGTAWDTAASETVDFFIENLPATAATPTGTFKLGFSLNGAAATYPMTVSSAGTITALASLALGGTSFVSWNSRTALASPANGQFNITNGAGSAGVGMDITTDSIMAVRTRAQTGDGSVRAALYSSSTVSTLSVSSNTIAPTGTIHHVGAGLIKTITVPATCTPTCTIQLVPDSAYTYDATGNVVVPSGGGTAVINKLMTLVWDGSKWTPSY
jgi:hypothetical protein